MKRLLLLLLLSLPSLAQAPREPFPSDYKPLPCAAKNICQPYPRHDFANSGGPHRRLPIRQEWVEAHWDEMMTAFQPICTKIGNCLAVPGNDWVFCADFMRWEFLATEARYPVGSDDRDQWKMSALIFYIGLDTAFKEGQIEARKCLEENPRSEVRKLEVWTTPAAVGPDYKGKMKISAIDAETRVPVKAYITIEGQSLTPADDSPDGRPMSFYPFPWPVTFNEVTSAAGHRDFVVPIATLKAEGYEVATIPIPVQVPKVIVEMQPPASKLVRGKNTVTIAAHDAATGKPVELRVLAGTTILGNTNKPLTLEITPGKKRPEIWATSLFNRYSDVVVAAGE